MDERERVILETLDSAVHAPAAAARIERIVSRVEEALACAPDRRMAWEPVPLDLYGGDLPGGVRSSWVFVLRAGATTGAERHPNSHQRMMAWRGGGDFQTRPGNEWISHRMQAGDAAGFRERCISIPPGVWHQGVVGDRDWAVVSFQTAHVEDLIEERPVGELEGEVRRRNYVGRDQEP